MIPSRRLWVSWRRDRVEWEEEEVGKAQINILFVSTCPSHYPLAWVTSSTHIKTQTHPYRSIPTQVKFNNPQIFSSTWLKWVTLEIWLHRICVQLSGWLITRFLEMCEGSQTTTRVIEPVCSHIQPDRPSCCN